MYDEKTVSLKVSLFNQAGSQVDVRSSAAIATDENKGKPATAHREKPRDPRVCARSSRSSVHIKREKSAKRNMDKKQAVVSLKVYVFNKEDDDGDSMKIEDVEEMQAAFLEKPPVRLRIDITSP
ncbi:hypothetical protein B566_EDAN016270 [Ephemera danica]|nr:hypothetical protein B566_EDAN016270 [Ephemera danica]